MIIQEPRSYDVIIQGRREQHSGEEAQLCVTIGNFGVTMWPVVRNLMAFVDTQRMRYPDALLWARRPLPNGNYGYVMEATDAVDEHNLFVIDGAGREEPPHDGSSISMVVGGDLHLSLRQWLERGQAPQEDLEGELAEALKQEDYERAARLRDRINARTA